MPQDYTQQLLELAKQRLAGEMPKEMAGASIAPMNPFDKWFGGPGTWAETDPGNRIRYNPEKFGHADRSIMEDILSHELTHVRQNQRDGNSLLRLLTTRMLHPSLSFGYDQDPEELEAWQTAKDRALRDHRVMPIGQGSFLGGPIRTVDINLPKDK